MQLIRFNPDLHLLNKETGIWIVNFSEYYLKDLCNRWGILHRIRGGWDDVPYRQGKHIFQKHIITVTDYEKDDNIFENMLLLILDSYPQGRYDQLINIPIVEEMFDDIYYYADYQMECELYYLEKYRHYPLEKILFFRSGPGASRNVPGIDFGDNAKALFDYLLKNNYDRLYRLVWLVRNPEEYAKGYYDRNIDFLCYSDAVSDDEEVREKYYRTLFLSEIIFFTNSGVFCRNAREDQTRVQLWHGCGFKSMKNTIIGRDEYKYEYMTVTSTMYADLHMEEFGLRREQILITGYPKDDLLFHPTKDWKELFHIPQADYYVFWLPTWRTTALKGEWQGNIRNKVTGLPIVEDIEQLDNLNDSLKNWNIVLIIKLHPWQERGEFFKWKMSNIILLENEVMNSKKIQINELLGHADALISDYSSVAVDFTLLDRPCAFTLDDEDEYQKERGFHWQNIRDWIPGTEIISYADLIGFLKNVVQAEDPCKEKRRRLDKLFHDYTDDRSAERVLRSLGIWSDKEYKII